MTNANTFSGKWSTSFFRAAALVALAATAACGDAGGAPGTGPGASSSPNPEWLAGEYVYNGNTSNNILMDHKTITFAKDGTYTGYYCKSCGNKPGKWVVSGSKIVLSGGVWDGHTIDLGADMTPNCRILTLEGKSFYRGGVVAGCPLGGAVAQGDACMVVGSYSKSTGGNPSSSTTLTLSADYFFYYSTMSDDSTCYGDICHSLVNGYEKVGTWSFDGNEPAGLPTGIDGLTFTKGSCDGAAAGNESPASGGAAPDAGGGGG